MAWTVSDHVKRNAVEARVMVHTRQYGICLACHTGVTIERMHLHHRKRRRDLYGDEQNCACVVVGLHGDCHVVAPQAVHQRPEWARERGLIVPSWADQREVPVESRWPFTGRLILLCDGGISQVLPDG